MPDKMAKAELAAVRRTEKTAKTRITRRIGTAANLVSADIKPRVVTTKKPSASSPTASIKIRGSRIPLWRFSRSMSDLAGFVNQKDKAIAKRKPKTGAGWKIYKGEGRKRYKGFFIDRETKSKQIQIFKRREGAKGGKDARPGRDYRTAFGLSLAEIWRRKNLKAPAVEEINEVLLKNLRSQVDRFLNRKKSDRA